MRKKICGIVILSLLAAVACACKGASDSKTEGQTEEKTEVPATTENNRTTADDRISDATYYGCPNSKRVKRLRVERKRA